MRAELVEPKGPLPEWQRFVREQGLHPGWDAAGLAALAGAGPARAGRPRPVRLGLVHDAGQVVALFCGQPLGPLFECRLPPSGSLAGFSFAGGLDPAGRRAATAAFERAVARALGRRCLAIAYRQVTAADHAVLGPGRRAQVRVGTSPSAVLRNRWSSMEEYFASLPSRRRADFRRRHRQVSSNPDLHVAVSRDGVAGAEASELAGRSLGRHRRLRPATPPPAAWFDALAGRDGVLFVSYRDGGGRLLAFDLTFDDGAELHAAVWGSLDPHGDGLPHLYLDHYLRLIRHMIERRRRGLHLGKGLAETKRRFGCELVPQQVLVTPVWG